MGVNGKFRLLSNRNKKFKESKLITIEEFREIVKKPCTYCGESVEVMGVDRVNNELGYTIENSTPCCMVCNFMKRVLSKEKFLEHIQKVYNNNFTKSK